MRNEGETILMSTTIRHDDASVGPIAVERLSLAIMAIPVLIVVGCAVVASTAPISVSIVAVFLFAGPHNWMEARYFLTRMPARWGGLAPYFSLGLGGSVFLTGMFAILPWLSGSNPHTSLMLVAVWNSLFTGWVIWLAHLRSQQNPRREWPFLIPFGFVLIAVNWLSPLAWSLALVYLHPLLALAFLDRELQRKPAVWRKSFRIGLFLVPVCLLAMAARWGNSPNIPGQDLLTWQITHHAGAEVISRVSTHFLVAAHVFLELLHYLVWILMIPMLNGRISFSRIRDVPLARRSFHWQRLVIIIVGIGAVMMMMLWASFLADYTWTRNIYFTVAILHVLMEIPFLLRSL